MLFVILQLHKEIGLTISPFICSYRFICVFNFLNLNRGSSFLELFHHKHAEIYIACYIITDGRLIVCYVHFYE